MITCKECKQIKGWHGWCHACNAKRFQQNFKNWTSGNDELDKFIQNTQLSAIVCYQTLEWIPYDRFYDIEYIAKGGFGKVYKATWIDGNILNWDSRNQNWNWPYPNKSVALKSLNNSKNVTLEFINEITSHHKTMKSRYIVTFYGITQDPETKNYMMVLAYADHGSLRNYLDKNYNKLNWLDKLINLQRIASGLNQIHENDLIHRDLHIGNILKCEGNTPITDMGLCRPADYNVLENTKKNIYGVLPYVAPEILRGQNYTKAADIYSFGIIMYEVISGLPPYHDVSHSKPLALNICQGLRPRFNIKVPQLILNLIKRCLDANPLNRPIANEIKNYLNQWRNEYDYRTNPNKQNEITKQIKEAEKINNSISVNNMPSTLPYETHSEAIYTSRLLNFNNLPEPKNSDDYYEQDDNITSMKYSETLQIDISLIENE